VCAVRPHLVLVLGALFCAAAARAVPPDPELYQVMVDLGRAEALLGRAHFREAGDKALLLRRQALALPPSADSKQLVVRSEVLAATAALALGHEAFARECLARAVRLDPHFALDANAPPKLRRAFEGVKGSGR
jgi:hypothetical protein